MDWTDSSNHPMSGPDHNPTVPIIIATPLDRAAESRRMAEEIHAEPDHARKVFLALRLVDFLIQDAP